MGMFNHNFQWLFIHDDSKITHQNMSIVQNLSVLNLSVNTQIVLFRRTMTSKTVFLYDVW